jgi:molybdenum cofactor cytidylyltransferase
VTSDPPIAAIVLAAGLSRRWGTDNKLLAPLAGAPMIRNTVAAVLRSAARPVIVVTGHDAPAVAAALAGLPVTFRHAAEFAQGMAASLKAGIAAVPPDCAGALICLGDMPFVKPGTLDRLARACGPMAVIPTWRGERGNPVLLGRALFPEIMHLSGDKGARALLGAVPDRVAELPVDDPGILRDLDRPEAPAE